MYVQSFLNCYYFSLIYFYDSISAQQWGSNCKHQRAQLPQRQYVAVALAISRDILSVCTVWLEDKDKEENTPRRCIGLLQSKNLVTDYTILHNNEDVFFLSHNNGFGLVDLGLSTQRLLFAPNPSARTFDVSNDALLHPVLSGQTLTRPAVQTSGKRQT